jgi:hypothetical protein
MSLRFQRRIKILPGLHLNLSKSGMGFSAGPRGFHVGIDSRKQPYWSAGLVGTGLSWREYPHAQPKPADAPRSGGCALLLLVLVILIVLAAIGSH